MDHQTLSQREKYSLGLHNLFFYYRFKNNNASLSLETVGFGCQSSHDSHLHHSNAEIGKRK